MHQTPDWVADVQFLHSLRVADLQKGDDASLGDSGTVPVCREYLFFGIDCLCYLAGGRLD